MASNIILVGNKTDIDDRRKVPFEEAVKLAKKLKLAAVFETSAKSNESIDDAFFRSVINCINMQAASNSNNDSSFLSRGGSNRSFHGFSANTELYRVIGGNKKLKNYDSDDDEDDEKEQKYRKQKSFMRH